MRLERVAEQLDEMKHAVDHFHAKKPFGITWKADPDGWRILRFREVHPIPAQWGVIVDELLHLLRATLNEAITDLVEANGERPKGTSFPIYVKRTGPDGYLTPRGKKNISPRDDYLAGLTDPQKTTIDGFQPFDRPLDPLARLARLTNVETHQRVQVAVAWSHEGTHFIKPLEPSGVSGMEIQWQSIEKPLEHDAELLRARSEPPGPVYVNGRLEFHEAFGPQRLIFPEIVEMKDRIVEIVERLQPEFDRT